MEKKLNKLRENLKKNKKKMTLQHNLQIIKKLS